ncbi:MAG: glycine oxidase ThiO [Planctomycetia bacterium]|nr:glycine oxidase ThiO [Planctomycetia bacterium]
MTADDVLIVGGGVIGLSLAYELARKMASPAAGVRVLDQSLPGRESSWAGAGILPAAVLRSGDHPYLQLAGLSHALHPVWSARLREETGCDNGYRRTGGLHLARTGDDVRILRQAAGEWRASGIDVRDVPCDGLAALEPALDAPAVLAAVHVPDEGQLRNPWHVRALLAACARRGVVVESGVRVEGFQIEKGRVKAVVTSDGTRSAGRVCVSSGAWTRALLAKIGLSVAIKPIRGQIVLLNTAVPPAVPPRHILNEGSRYLVPRTDGRVLVGSTEEDAGFDTQTTPEGVTGLMQLAITLCPSLRAAPVEAAWAGLRPGSADGLPYLGPVPGVENCFVAAGHFRSGLHLSTGTAVVMSQLILGLSPEVDLAPFALDRH